MKMKKKVATEDFMVNRFLFLQLTFKMIDEWPDEKMTDISSSSSLRWVTRWRLQRRYTVYKCISYKHPVLVKFEMTPLFYFFCCRLLHLKLSSEAFYRYKQGWWITYLSIYLFIYLFSHSMPLWFAFGVLSTWVLDKRFLVVD